MSDDTALSVAKEITLAIIPKVSIIGNAAEPEAAGNSYGKLFKVVLTQVVEGIRESHK